MLTQWNHLNLARITLEAITPISIQTGQGSQYYDTSLVRDANGLPVLPATSIRGVLRHLFCRLYSEDITQELFGVSTSNTLNDKTSRIQVSWGALHDSQNNPIEGLALIDQNDQMLQSLLDNQPITRDRVRLNHQGTAEDQAKFDITACPTGSRFTFEIKLWSDTANTEQWHHILSALQHPQFRLGHSTRSGFGAFAVVGLSEHTFDFRDPESVKQWQQLPRGLTAQTLSVPLATGHNDTAQKTITLTLKAEDFIRIGGTGAHYENTDEPATLVMQAERIIVWEKNRAKLSKRFPLIPASGVKGALSHRLIYHTNRLKQQFSNDLNSDSLLCHAQRDNHAEIVALLGQANNEENSGLAGSLYVNDVYLTKPQSVSQLWHNRIDRFTGGVIEGALFSEEVLFEPEVTLTIHIAAFDSLDDLAKLALHASLEDLCQGRLPLGSGGSRGLGCFTGTHDFTLDVSLSEQGERA